MKKGIIYDLYFGHLVPAERGRSQDPDYTSLTRKISGIKARFEASLSPDEYQQFEELEKLYTQAMEIEDVDIFEYGLRMGIMLMIEVFGFRQTCLPDGDND